MHLTVLEQNVLEQKRDRLLHDATQLLHTAEHENRALTAEETTRHDGWLTELETVSKSLVQLKGDRGILDEIERLTNGEPSRLVVERGLARKSLGQLVTESALGKWLVETKSSRPQHWHSPSIELKTTLLEGTLPVMDRQPEIAPLPTRRLVMADLPAPGTTTSNLIGVMRETAFTNAAAAVPEGEAKPESGLVFDLVQEPVRKIATWLPVSEECLDDVPQMQSYINERLALFVQIELDDQLLNGAGVGADLVGFLNRAGLAPPVARVDPATNLDALLAQIAAIETTSGLPVDGIVLNPTNLIKIFGSKTTSGEYLVGSPFTMPATPTLWGVRFVSTPAIVAGTALVGAFRSASQLFFREMMKIDASNSHQDFFIKNLVAIRAELRAALAVTRPAAFGLVTGLT